MCSAWLQVAGQQAPKVTGPTDEGHTCGQAQRRGKADFTRTGAKGDASGTVIWVDSVEQKGRGDRLREGQLQPDRLRAPLLNLCLVSKLLAATTRM